MRADWPLEVFYDGVCPLCRREIAHYRKRDRKKRVVWVDIAQPTFNAEAYGLDTGRVQQVMHARLKDGRIVTEVGAFVKIWEAIPSFGTTLLRFLLKVPGMMGVAGWFYRAFARNRYRLTGRCTPESCEM